MRNLIGLMLGAALVVGCSKSEGGKMTSLEKGVTYEVAFPGLSFARPVYFAEVPGKPETYLVLEQPGGIQIISREGAGWSKSEFGRVQVTGGESGGDERGLLGFAFHPDYAKNRKYFLFYVFESANVLSEGIADSSLIKDSGAPRRVLLSIPDPYANHNGGTLAFGPRDGFLYLGTGDGGSGGDPQGNGQNKHALLGKFLRIDVNSQAGGKPYAIPPDNPFLDGSGAPEVWAYGLRNPWKWSFDSLTGDLWAGDVGQNRLEEVDIIERGGNYGWDVWEGDQCHPQGGTDCDLQGHKPPLFTYGRDDEGGTSITGGLVYRGNVSSLHYGSFLFGDYGTDNVWSMKKTGQATPLPRAPDIGISSFGTDSQRRVYIMGVNSKSIYRINGLDSLP
ncbi:MAG: PQQ-dependent sugar dehydrogenase [Fibrobacterota bacterium]|nr:PQQ-dependent sugar dehydrogenase [Fibrobacterota bacterium]